MMHFFKNSHVTAFTEHRVDHLFRRHFVKHGTGGQVIFYQEQIGNYAAMERFLPVY
jgi:hypothetical protein